MYRAADHVQNVGYSADVNECVSPDNNDCEQTCVNTNGSYSCDCTNGYVLNADGHACDGRFILALQLPWDITTRTDKLLLANCLFTKV